MNKYHATIETSANITLEELTTILEQALHTEVALDSNLIEQDLVLLQVDKFDEE